MFLALGESGVAIYNVSDPDVPVLIHSINLYDYNQRDKALNYDYSLGGLGSIVQLSVLGDRLTVFQNWGENYNVYNISNPLNPEIIESGYENIRFMDASEKYQCKVLDRGFGDMELIIQTINDSEIIQIGSYGFDYGECFAENDYVYYITNGRIDRFLIINDTVTQLAGFNFFENFRMFGVSQNILFEVSNYDGRQLFMTNFTNPSQISSHSLSFEEELDQIVFYNNNPYVLSVSSVYLINMTTFSHSKLFDINEDNNIQDLEISQSTVYLYNWQELMLYHQTNGMVPIRKQSNGEFNQVEIYNDYIISIGWGNGINVFSNDLEFQTYSLANYSSEGGYYKKSGDKLYLYSSGSFWYNEDPKFHIMNLEALPEIEIQEISLPSYWVQFEVIKDIIYVRVNDLMTAYEIQNNELVVLSTVNREDFGWILDHNENYIIMQNNERIEFFEISDPTNIRWVGSYTHDIYFYDFELFEDTLILIDDNGYTIVDFSNPAAPTKLLSSPIGGVFGKQSWRLSGVNQYQDFILLHMEEFTLGETQQFILVCETNILGDLTPLAKIHLDDEYLQQTYWGDTIFLHFDYRLVIQYVIPDFSHSEAFEDQQTPATNLNYVLLGAVIIIAVFSLRKQLKLRSTEI